MTTEKRLYKLIQNYKSIKSDILEIGADNCSLINYFIIKGYKNPIALDEKYAIPEKCFLTYNTKLRSNI